MNVNRACRSILITGGNGALGFATAKHVAASGGGWHVILTSRNRARAEASAEQLRKETGYPSIEGVTLDLASLQDVRRFIAALMARNDLPPLHALVLNAAIQVTSSTTYTTDGFETNFGVNHLANFLLVNLLIPHIRSPGRIVFVTSGTHKPDDWLARATGVPAPRYREPEKLAFPDKYPDLGARQAPAALGRMRYATSKLCNVLTTYELARRFGKANIDLTVNAFDPGLMPGTGLARDATPFEQLLWKRVLPALRFVPNVNTAERSGHDLAWLVLTPELLGVTGKYFGGTAVRPSSAESYDARKAEALWEGSANLVQLERSYI